MKEVKMYSLICFFFAAVFNAFMDRISEGRFQESIFKNLNPDFWYAWQSWKVAKKIGSYPLDAWHIAKSLLWASIALGAITYKPIFPYWPLDFITIGLVIILTFNTFYNHIFKKP